MIQDLDRCNHCSCGSGRKMRGIKAIAYTAYSLGLFEGIPYRAYGLGPFEGIGYRV